MGREVIRKCLRVESSIGSKTGSPQSREEGLYYFHSNLLGRFDQQKRVRLLRLEGAETSLFSLTSDGKWGLKRERQWFNPAKSRQIPPPSTV
jgi:hypothetical protein